MKIANPSLQNKILFLSFILLTTLGVTLHYRQKSLPVAEAASPSTAGADTYIPKGFVLVPIELQNIQAIAGLIGDHGLIDLYGSTADGTGFALAEMIKIIQAPLNPEQYAVLTSENLARKIMHYRGSYWGVVRNRSAEATRKPRFVQTPAASSILPSTTVAERTALPEKKSPLKKRIRRKIQPIEIEYQSDLDEI